MSKQFKIKRMCTTFPIFSRVAHDDVAPNLTLFYVLSPSNSWQSIYPTTNFYSSSQKRIPAQVFASMHFATATSHVTCQFETSQLRVRQHYTLGPCMLVTPPNSVFSTAWSGFEQNIACQCECVIDCSRASDVKWGHRLSTQNLLKFIHLYQILSNWM